MAFAARKSFPSETMLNTVRTWFSGAKPNVREPEALCLVVTAEPLARERLAATVTALGVRVEMFSDPAALAEAAQSLPDLVFMDTAIGAGVGDAVRALGALAKKPALQLFCTGDPKNYEQLCAMGLARLAGDAAGLRVTSAMQATVSSEAVQRCLHDLGLRKNSATSVTLAQALERGWLELFYQPKIEFATKRLAGAEGLIRARHPELGILPPGAFLPGASEHHMLKLTEQVILTALRDFDACAAQGAPVKFSVNTPVSALTRLPIAEMLRTERPKSESWPGLILEVTEDEIIPDLKLANDVAAQLREHRCSLAIDDFGAGYSSLARLRQLPFCELKIDRSYVMHCNRDRTNAGLCETIVELAKRFGLTTVAEGVETAHESHKLQSLGCEVGQGYLFAKPMSKRDFLANLRQRRVRRAS